MFNQIYEIEYKDQLFYGLAKSLEQAAHRCMVANKMKGFVLDEKASTPEKLVFSKQKVDEVTHLYVTKYTDDF